MALDLRGFTYEPNNFQGLYRISDEMRRNKLQEDELDKEQEAQKSANAKYFGNLLNKKDYLTGTNYDPATNKLLNEAFDQAMQLSSKGASIDQILMATQPLMGKVNDYMSKAKMYSDQKKQVLDHFKEAGGYDLGKINDLLDKYTFFDDKGNLDVDNADPSLKNAIQKIDENNLADVATSAGINKWADKFPKEEREDNITTTDKFGNKKISKLNVKASSWEMPEYDQSGNVTFVPKYEIATDNKQPIVHAFTNADGTTTQSTVRLLDRNVFQNLISSDQSAADYIKGNLRNVIKSGEFKDDNGNLISINSPKADMIARAFAYDYLKGRTGGVVSQASQQITSPYQIKLNLGIPINKQSGSGNGEITINDVYNTIDQMATERAGQNQYLRVNALPAEAQGLVIDFAKKLTGDNLIGQGDIEIYKHDGNIGIYYANGVNKNRLIGNLTQTGTNLKVQPSVKEKREVIEKGNKDSKKNDPLGIFE